MEVIKPGKYVELGYDLYSIDADGHETLMHQTDAEDHESFVLDVTRGFLKRGNGMVYFPRILEFLESEVRESANTSVAGMIDAVSKRLEREDNFWVVVGKRQQ